MNWCTLLIILFVYYVSLLSNSLLLRVGFVFKRTLVTSVANGVGPFLALPISDTKQLAVILSLSIVFLVIVILIIVVWRRTKKYKRYSSEIQTECVSNEAGSCTSLVLSLPSDMIMTCQQYLPRQICPCLLRRRPVVPYRLFFHPLPNLEQSSVFANYVVKKGQGYCSLLRTMLFFCSVLHCLACESDACSRMTLTGATFL